jgi:manganese/zinc/iron transport system permease protein
VRTQYYELALAIAIVVTVVIGLQMVGVVLMAAVLLIPIAAARYWSHQLSQLLWLSAFIGLLAGAVSTNISYSAPAMPSGPWMVLVLFVLFFISLIFAPQRGLLSKALRAHQQGLKVDQENVLRSFYVLAEREANPMSRFSPAAIYRVRNMRQSALMQALRVLTARGDLKAEAGQYWLSKQGLEQAKDLTRYHRLWEMYLATQANIDPDKVHGQAEQSEHVMTPELGERLAEELGHPTIDPHGKPIPTKGEGL